MPPVGDTYQKASELMARLRDLIDSGALRTAPDKVLDAVARAVGDLARLRSGSESDLLAAISQASTALDAAESWMRQKT
jgi:hypothetical protein